MDEETTSQVGVILGRVPSGCFILTARSGDASSGMLASWVQQAGFDPPTVTLSVKKGRPVVDLIDASGHFVLNCLGADPKAMFKHFGKGFGPGEEAFSGLAVEPCEAGMILRDCPAHLGCRVVGKHDAGDHWLYVGEVIGAGGNSDFDPYVHLRENGLSY